jgi:two-component system sensor kinase
MAEQLYRIAERGAETADSTTRYRVAQSLGDVLMLRGRYPDAAIRFKAARALTTDPLSQAQTEGKLAELAFKVGDMKAAIEANERALRMLGNRVPRWWITFFFRLLRETLVQVLHTKFPRLFLARKKLAGSEKRLLSIRLHNRLAYCYWFGKGKISCLWTHLRGMNQAERFSPTLELAQAYSIHAPVMSLLPNINRGIAYAEKSYAIYKSLGDLWGQGQSLHFHGIVLYVAARFEGALEKLREGVRLLERTGDYWEVNIAGCHICNTLYRQGDLPGAVAEAKRIYTAGVELGDTQAMGICLDVWARASGGQIPSEILQTELQRPRADVQVSAQVMLAEGVRLFMLDRVEEAAVIFDQGSNLAARRGVKNAWTVSLRPWLASALRRQAEKARERHWALLKRARQVVMQALKVARIFQDDLPHALREAGLIVAMQGSFRQARKYLDESLEVAQVQGARFEHAQTLLARGRVGQQHGWPEARQDLTTAMQVLHSIGGDFVLGLIANP